MKVIVLALVLIFLLYSLVGFFSLDDRRELLREIQNAVEAAAAAAGRQGQATPSIFLSGDVYADNINDGPVNFDPSVDGYGDTQVGEMHGVMPVDESQQQGKQKGKWYDKLTSLNPFKTSSNKDHNVHSSDYDYDDFDGSRSSSSSHVSGKPQALHSGSDLILPDRVSLGERTRIAKVSILYGHPNAVYERALRTHEAHDRLHNYPIYVVREQILDGLWTKPAYILSLILQELEKPESQRLEWLFWVDADTIILNYKVPIELFLPPEGGNDDPFREVYMLVSHDWNGLNNGVFPVRINSWSAELFAAIVAFRDFRPDTKLVFNDQSAMEFVLQERKFAKHVVQVPQRWFNAYQGEANETLAPHQVRRGDFLVHFPGVGDRETRMRYWLERAEQHMPEWEMDLQHTSYPAEVREFWGQLRREREEMRALFQQTVGELAEYVNEVQQLSVEYGSSIPPEALEKILEEVHNAKDVTEAQWEMQQDLADAITALARLKEASSPVFPFTAHLDPMQDIKESDQSCLLVSQLSQPLSQASVEAKKELVKAAYELIFGAEHAALEFSSMPTLGEDVKLVNVKIEGLKTELTKPDATPAMVQAMVEEVKAASQLLKTKGEEFKSKARLEGAEESKTSGALLGEGTLWEEGEAIERH